MQKMQYKLNGKYLLFDDDTDRNDILKKTYVNNTYVCLDEFHKYARWKNHIKGVKEISLCSL
ncbi:MAG: hypothetical protein HQK49_05970 [Oligoflexia bacterium]|nr:hypothetical protein [Oligoflexia bacterium]